MLVYLYFLTSSLLSKQLPPTYIVMYYSDGHKSCTFSHDFFCGPPGEGGPILELVDYVKWSSPSVLFFPKRYL